VLDATEVCRAAEHPQSYDFGEIVEEYSRKQVRTQGSAIASKYDL